MQEVHSMSESYEKMTVLELRQVAKEKGVKLGAGISKQGIIDKLLQSEQEQTSAAPEAPAPAARPVRSASIIVDDDPEDSDDVPVLTPNPSVQLAPRKPVARPAPQQTQAASSLSSISSKAPAFTMEGSRAWHNPMAYQTQTSYQNRSAYGGQTQRAQSPYGASRPALDTRYAPRANAAQAADNSRFAKPQAAYQAPNRFGPDLSAPADTSAPNPPAGEYPAPEQSPAYPQYRADYAPQPVQEYIPPTATEYPPRRENAPGTQGGIPEILMAGECGDGAGVLELHPDGYGFLRAENFLPSKNDVYVSNAQIRRFSLRSGDYVVGKTRPQVSSSRYSALLYITEINGHAPEEVPQRPSFDTLTAIYPKKRIPLHADHQPDLFLRAVDLLSPIGYGQRALIHAPQKSGRTTLLKKLANAIHQGDPDVQLMTLLIDERPEDVVDMKESVPGDVLYSTFDAPAENHVRVSELTLERAQRMVEQKKNVVLLIDSLSKLCRAYNTLAPQTARALPNGLAMGVLQKPKKLFGAARNTREGGSLTIIATMQTNTKNPLDEAILEEFRGTANMELFLERIPGEKRMLPCADFGKSGTRHDELMLSLQEQALSGQIKEKLQELPSRSAVQLIAWLEKAQDLPALEEQIKQ